MIVRERSAERGVLVPVAPAVDEPIPEELAASAGVVFDERAAVA